MSKKKIHYIGMVFSHHSKHSGYHRLLDHIEHDPLPTFPVSPLFTPLRGYLVKRSLRTWYHYGRREVSTELDILFYPSIRERHLYHFIYGENTFCYSANFNRRGKTFIASYHWPESWFRKQGPERFKALTEKMRNLDCAIAVSSDQAEFIGRYNKNVFTVHHGIDTEFFTPGPVDGRDPGLCLFVGNWLRDFETLKRVNEVLAFRRPGLRLEVVTPERNRKLFEGTGMEVLSGISDTELRDRYRKASVLVQPLIDCTANNSALEAMACGLPVVVTDIGGIHDYLDDDCAVFCPPGDAEVMAGEVLRLLDSPERRASMGEAARRRALERFSWPVVAGQMEEIYNKF